MSSSDKDIRRARALVVDGNALSRTVLSTQLRDLGLDHVTQSGRLADARVHIERALFDIVLCDYHFDGSEATGQDFLDEIRREKLLPWSSVFIMVTGEATYARVAEAAESALDGYLIKPYRASALADRILQARKRKKELGPLLQALDQQDWSRALLLSAERVERRKPYWPYAARLAAELHLQEGDAIAAQRLFETVRHLLDDPPWARLGVARARLAAGDLSAARQALADLRRRDPGFADACDVLGRLELEAGDMSGALETFRAASNITPGCLLRLQQTGNVAFICGESAEALDLLERTVSFGLRSKLFDAWTLLLIAFLRHDNADARPVTAACDQLAKLAARHASPDRLRRLWLCARSLQRLLAADGPTALALATELAAEPLQPGLEPSAAYATLALLSRFPKRWLTDDEACRLAEPLAMRFATSKVSVDTMANYARKRPPLADMVQRCHRDTTRLAEESMAHALRGDHQLAIEGLIDSAERTGNRRLVEMAATMLKRHQGHLGDAAAELGLQISSLGARFVHGGQVLAGEGRTARRPGGMVVRSAQPTPEAPAVRIALPGPERVEPARWLADETG